MDIKRQVWLRSHLLAADYNSAGCDFDARATKRQQNFLPAPSISLCCLAESSLSCLVDWSGSQCVRRCLSASLPDGQPTNQPTNQPASQPAS